MIANYWEPWFTEKYGHHFPSTYMCVDTEFTGSDADKDIIVDIGHVIVEDGRIVDERSVLIDWTKTSKIDQSWLRYKLDLVRANVKGNWNYSTERMTREGISPEEALGFYADLFAIWRKRNLPFALQNGITADERLLRGNFERFLGKSFEFPADAYFDTGGIFKATQIITSTLPDVAKHKMTAYPQASDTLKSYFQRVIHVPIRGVHWSLKHILASYGLDQQHNVDAMSMHGACYDATCVHWIMEEMRKRVYRSNIVECPADSSMSLQRLFEQEQAMQLAVKGPVDLGIDKQPLDFEVPKASRSVAAVSPAARQRLRRRQRPA